MASRKEERPPTEVENTGAGTFQIAIVNGRILLEFDRPMLGVGFGLKDAEAFHRNFALAIQHLLTQTPLVPPAGPPS